MARLICISKLIVPGRVDLFLMANYHWLFLYPLRNSHRTDLRTSSYDLSDRLGWRHSFKCLV